MPYHLEKGRALSFVENYLNEGLPEQRMETLRKLRNGNVQLGAQTLTNAALDTGYRPYTGEALIEYVKKKWFGQGANTYWLDYEGDVEGIVRLTLIRAMEVALGVEHGQDPGVPPRSWPVELLWHCSQRWFEGWVTWQTDEPNGCGHVLILLASPAHAGGLITRQALHPETTAPQPNGRAAADIQRPPIPYDPSGMWVITHAEHNAVPIVVDEIEVRLTFAGAQFKIAIPFFGEKWVGGNGPQPMPRVDPLTQTDFPDLVTAEPNLAAGGVK
jgi:hypothetical protein